MEHAAHHQPDAAEVFPALFVGQFENRAGIEAHFMRELGIDEALTRSVESLPGWMAGYVGFDIAGCVHDLERNGDITVVDNGEGELFVFKAR